jgi:hypothetical protein
MVVDNRRNVATTAGCGSGIGGRSSERLVEEDELHGSRLLGDDVVVG